MIININYDFTVTNLPNTWLMPLASQYLLLVLYNLQAVSCNIELFTKSYEGKLQ